MSVTAQASGGRPQGHDVRIDNHEGDQPFPLRPHINRCEDCPRYICRCCRFQRRVRQQSGSPDSPRRRRPVAIQSGAGPVLWHVERSNGRLVSRKPPHRTDHRRRQPATGFRCRILVLRGDGGRQRSDGEPTAAATGIRRRFGAVDGQHVGRRRRDANSERVVTA